MTKTKTLTYSGFVIAGLLVVAVFMTAKTYTQLAIAILLYPLLAYFAFKLFPRKARGAPVITIRLPAKSNLNRVETTNPKEQVRVADIDKRAFLKLIGATGLSFFLFSILGRRVETILFGQNMAMSGFGNSAGGEAGTTEPSPTDGYKISEIDDGVISYYGFTNKDGSWLIMQEDTNTSSFRYAKGGSNFSSNWAKREKLRYDYYYNLF